MRPLNAIENRIAETLAKADFDGLIRELIRNNKGGLATRYVEARASAYLGGSTKSSTHVWYLFIDGPFDECLRAVDMKRLGKSIPYLHWTWEEFMELTASPAGKTCSTAAQGTA